MTSLPNFRREQTGNAVLDRMQDVVRDLVSIVRDLVRTTPTVYSLILRGNLTTTSATPTSTALRFPVRAGDVWDIDYTGYSSCSSVNGCKLAVACPTGSTLAGELESSSTNTLVANWFTQALTASTLSAALHAGANDNGRPDRINARVTVGTDGYITLQFASATAATTTTLYARSCLRAVKAVGV